MGQGTRFRQLARDRDGGDPGGVALADNPAALMRPFDVSPPAGCAQIDSRVDSHGTPEYR